jgi:thymidylate synthase
MSGTPVLHAEGDCIARAWENALVTLYESGCDIQTQYDKPGDPPSKDATMILVVHDPLAEPMIHRDFPGGFQELEEYVMEVCEGIKDHWVRDPGDPADTRWEYTYHQRLFGYEVPTLAPIDQIEQLCRRLAETPHTRRAQAITWKVWEDNTCYDPACLQSIWCRITDQGARGEGRGAREEGSGARDQSPIADPQSPMPNPQSRIPNPALLSMNVRFRSNDAYKAAFMNIFALVQLQQRIAARIEQLSGSPVKLGRYCHMADSFHIYGSNLAEFEGRFLGAIQNRSFEQRTMRYEDVRQMMEEARPAILEKARKMGRETHLKSP